MYNHMKLLEKLKILGLCLFMTGCGYFSDEPVPDAGTYSSEKLANSCEINVEELTQILEKDVHEQIDCLEQNLMNFTKYVRRENPDSVNDSELGGFIRRFFQGHAHIIIDSMGLIFDINSLFLRDSNNAISTENIKPLFNLLRVANTEMSSMTQTYKLYGDKKIALEDAQKSVQNDLQEFSSQVKDIISKNGRGADSQINLKEFFERVSQQFETFQMTESTLNGILALKKLFLGGKREVLTRNELFTLLDQLPDMGSTAFFLLYADSSNQGSATHYFSQVSESIQRLSEKVYPHRREEIIFKDGEVENLIRAFMGDDSDLYVEVAQKVKKHLLGTGSDTGPYTYHEMRNISFLSQAMIEGLIFAEAFKESTQNNKDWNKGLYLNNKESFLASYARFEANVTKGLNDNIYFPRRVEFFKFIEFLSEKFEDFPIKSEYLPILPLVKVSLVGGFKESFNKLELLNLLAKSKTVADLSFDLFFSSEDTHSDQEKSRLYYIAAKEVRQLITGQKYLHVTTVDNLVEIISDAIEKPSIRNYQSTLEALKEKILGGYPGAISVADVGQMLEMAEAYLGRNYYFDISFDAYRDQLSKNGPLRYLEYRHHQGYRFFSQDEVLAYKKEFFKLVKSFRVYREEDGTQYYGNDHRRTKRGVLEIFLIRHFYSIVAEAFGEKIRDKELYGLNIEKLNEVLFLFKPILEDFGLWSPYPETFARNALLLADLFQGQSDGNLIMDPNEATEYGTLALFAIQTADDLVEKTKKYCDWVEAKGVEGFKLECYREKFFKVFLNEINLKEKLPKLTEYIENASQEEAYDFLVAVEGFARESQDQDRPETRKDLVLLIGAMLNIESTFLRYDQNNNNILDPHELDRAFPVYEDAIMSLANLDESKRGYAKSIFLFMIKKMKMPSQWDIATFHYNPFANKLISSKRLNIGALLYNMLLAAEENRKARKEAIQSAP